jgi:hypothetical protein
VAGCCKSFAGVTADITGSARDEDVQSHGAISPDNELGLRFSTPVTAVA